MKGKTTETVIYMIIGVLLAFGINQGLAFALTTDMPVVAVESNSMVPVFYKGDILVLQGADSTALDVGDVIVYSVAGKTIPIVHRIVKINSDGSYQTKGDANSGQLNFEFYIEPKDVHGRVFMIIPNLGWVKIGVMDLGQVFIKNLLYVLIAIILVAFIYFGRRLI